MHNGFTPCSSCFLLLVCLTGDDTFPAMSNFPWKIYQSLGATAGAASRYSSSWYSGSEPWNSRGQLLNRPSGEMSSAPSDVIVIGGGLAGSRASLQLARAGLSVI